MFDKNKINFQFMFMFASPNYIVYKAESPKPDYKASFARLNNKEEFEIIKDTVKKQKVEIKLHKEHGTFKNLEDKLMELKPSGVHFSGHGVRAADIKNELDMAKKKGAIITEEMYKEAEELGDRLVLETEDCQAEYLSEF
jgi:hypothetical protein